MASTHKILPAGSGPTSIARIRMPPPPLQRFQPWNSRECTSHSVFSLAPLGRQIEWPSRYATARFRWVFAETTSVRLFRTRLLRMDRLSTWRYPSRSNQNLCIGCGTSWTTRSHYAEKKNHQILVQSLRSCRSDKLLWNLVARCVYKYFVTRVGGLPAKY